MHKFKNKEEDHYIQERIYEYSELEVHHNKIQGQYFG